MSSRKAQVFSAARKTARALAVIMPGKGRVRINHVPVELVRPEMARGRIISTLVIAGELREKVDIDVEVKGGGFMGQAEAAAIAISRALVGWSRGKELKERIVDLDKHLLSGDSRRTEPKKFGGPGARRKKQKSYR